MVEKLRAAIYVRISRDQTGEGLGVERQEKDCRAVAGRLGWEVIAVYCDNDISAYSGKPRPQYRAMLSAVKNGQISAVLAWHPDRLYRRAIDLEEIVTIAETHHLQIATATAGDVNLSTPAGRMNARIIAAVAQGEVENTKSRVRSKKLEAAAAGKYRGGPRPYGYEKDGVTVREDEAQVIREATTAILSGRSLKAVANELNDKKRMTSTGKAWTYQRLRDVLVRPRNAGKLSRGRADRGEFEIVGDAVWPAIVSEDEWRAVHDLLLDPSRRTHQNTEARWIGSNTYLCGVDGCGATMRSSVTTDKRAGKTYRRYYYRCNESSHLSIHSEKTDKFVEAVLVEKVRDPRLVQAMTDHDGDGLAAADRERRTMLTVKLSQTELDYDTDLIDARRYKAKIERINAEIAEIDARLAEVAKQSTASPIFTAADPGAAFLAAPIDVRRAVLRSVLRVTVLPVAKRGDKWSANRLHFDSLI